MTGRSLGAARAARCGIRWTGCSHLAIGVQLGDIAGRLWWLQTDLLLRLRLLLWLWLLLWLLLLLLNLYGGSGTGLYEGCAVLLSCGHHQAHGRRVDLANGTELSVGAHNILLATGAGRYEGGLVLWRGRAQHHLPLMREQTRRGHILYLQQRCVWAHDQAGWHKQLLPNEIHVLQYLAILEQQLLRLGCSRRWLVDHNALNARAQLELLRELWRRCGRCNGSGIGRLLQQGWRLAGYAGRDLGRMRLRRRAAYATDQRRRRSAAHGGLALSWPSLGLGRRYNGCSWLWHAQQLLVLLLMMLLLLLLLVMDDVAAIGQCVEQHSLRRRRRARRTDLTDLAGLRANDLMVQQLSPASIKYRRRLANNVAAARLGMQLGCLRRPLSLRSIWLLFASVGYDQQLARGGHDQLVAATVVRHRLQLRHSGVGAAQRGAWSTHARRGRHDAARERRCSIVGHCLPLSRAHYGLALLAQQTQLRRGLGLALHLGLTHLQLNLRLLRLGRGAGRALGRV